MGVYETMNGVYSPLRIFSKLPDYRIDEFCDRQQPFTVWRSINTIYFCDSLEKAEAYIMRQLKLRRLRT